MTHLRILALQLLLLLSAALMAVDKGTYYKGAAGQKKAGLKTALCQIIGNPSVKSYGSLWTYFYQTDRQGDNRVVDRYSNTAYYFGARGAAVSGMNKEHSVPKSWWGGTVNDAYSDLHHLMPSDETANNRKSNYGMGVVTEKVTYENGSIKVGRGTAGNNGKVNLWEPADEWKGDFARMHFYLVTCYEELSMVQGEGANTMQANTYPKLQPWAYELYMKWSREDPVDDLERQRNETVYGIQGNRNPFIDYPGLEQYIWGTHTAEPFSPSAYVSPFGGATPDPDPDPAPDPEPDPEPVGVGDYVKVTTVPTDWSGTYLIVYEDGGLVMNGGLEGKLDAPRNTLAVTIADTVIARTDDVDAASFTIEAADGGYTIRSSSGLYMGQTKDENGLLSSAQTTYVNTLSFTDAQGIDICCGGAHLRYNATSGQERFRYYKSATYTQQKPVALYRQTTAAPAVPGDVNGDGQATIADVTALVNLILGTAPASPQADVNGDGQVTIADVTALVNIILGKTNE